MFYLTIEDDGIGIDDHAKPAGTGLGQRLLKSMTAQISGTVELRSKRHDGATGTLAVVRFPVDP